MRKVLAFGVLVSAFAVASQAAAAVVPAPAPLVGAGIPSLAVLAVAGAGYVAMRLGRKNRD